MKTEIVKPNFAGFDTVIFVDREGNKQYAKLPKKAKNVNEAVLHREDGPAVEYVNTYQAWYKNGKLHREDGPAVEFAGRACSFWKNGVKVESACKHAWEKISGSMAESHYKCQICNEEDWR